MEAVAAAARLSLERAPAPGESQLEKVKESRSRRRRGRRGARAHRAGHPRRSAARLVALALELRRRRGSSAKTRPRAFSRRSSPTRRDELQVAVEGLRELARDPPGILVQGGLAAALEALAGRSPIPVTVETHAGSAVAESRGRRLLRRLGGARERRKARRRSQSVHPRDRDGRTLVIEVGTTGSAARPPRRRAAGLADRVEAQGGRLRSSARRRHASGGRSRAGRDRRRLRAPARGLAFSRTAGSTSWRGRRTPTSTASGTPLQARRRDRGRAGSPTHGQGRAGCRRDSRGRPRSPCSCSRGDRGGACGAALQRAAGGFRVPAEGRA